MQGFSGIKTMGDGTFLVLTDNGFGAKRELGRRHADRSTASAPTGRAARWTILETIFLRDPDRKVPFHITNEGTPTRYLTGADFDIESIQPIGDKLWFGDEFGPYLIRTDKTGKVQAVFETMVDGKLVRSPDHFQVLTPAAPGGKVDFTVRRSRGYRGHGRLDRRQVPLSAARRPAVGRGCRRLGKRDGKAVLRILEFSTAEGEWTGRSWNYPLELAGNNIGDFNMIDAATGLIIERDNGEGAEAEACPQGPRPAGLLQRAGHASSASTRSSCRTPTVGGLVRKIGYIDLMDIQDPKGLARQGGSGRQVHLPLRHHRGRRRGRCRPHHRRQRQQPALLRRAASRRRNDDNEFVLLHVGEFLAAK